MDSPLLYTALKNTQEKHGRFSTSALYPRPKGRSFTALTNKLILVVHIFWGIPIFRDRQQ